MKNLPSAEIRALVQEEQNDSETEVINPTSALPLHIDTISQPLQNNEAERAQLDIHD